AQHWAEREQRVVVLRRDRILGADAQVGQIRSVRHGRTASRRSARRARQCTLSDDRPPSSQGFREQTLTTSNGRFVPTLIGVHRGSPDDKVWHMRMVKYTHACVRLHDGDRDLLIDPGTWAEDAAFDGAGDVLVTHEHADHIDLDRLVAAYRANPALRVFMPAAVATQVIEKAPSFEPATHAIAVGDSFTAGGF